MSIKNRVGISLGVLSILFSTFCLIVMPVFTGAILAALLAGVVFGAVAACLGAPRTASVTLVFALVPACGFLAMESARIGYAAFIPLAGAIALAAWAIGAARSKRPHRDQRAGS